MFFFCIHLVECVIQTPNGSLSVFLIQAAGGEYDGIIQGRSFLIFSYLYMYISLLMLNK